MKQTGLMRLDKLAMKKIIGGAGAVIAGCTEAGEVKCGRLIPCPKGCSCAGNRCFPDDAVAVPNDTSNGTTVGVG